MSRLPFGARVAALVIALLPLGSVLGAAPPLAPSKGEILPYFETTRIDGQPHRVDFPKGSKTVLLFFSSACPHCHKMIPIWNSAYERRPDSVEVVGVIVDKEPPGFWGTMPIAFPVVRSPGRLFMQSIHVNRVPLTLRVVEGGRIEDVASGVTDPIRLGELFKP